MRGSIEDLAAVLVQQGVSSDKLLLGDWRPDADLLSAAEQNELSQAMTAQQSVAKPARDTGIGADR